MDERVYLLFFGDTPRRAWWANFLRPGFRHIAAMSYHADAERWVYVDPALRWTVIRILTQEPAGRQIAVLLEQSTAVLRMASRPGRGGAPAFPWCVGQIKALIGVRTWALTPWQLYRSLIRRGAEHVDIERQFKGRNVSDVERPGRDVDLAATCADTCGARSAESVTVKGDAVADCAEVHHVENRLLGGDGGRNRDRAGGGKQAGEESAAA
jgi:hypothetical protein